MATKHRIAMGIAQPIVSVITCFYNEETFLEETIQSVLAQTYTNWELLLIDDGSPDTSPAIAKRYTDAYPDKIIYLQHEQHANKGVCKSRNLGIVKSRGKFIAYLDADDVWLPDKLQNQLDIFTQHPEAAVLLEASSYWYSWQSAERKNVLIPIGSTEQNKLYTPPQLMLQLYPLGKGAAPCPSGMMVRRSVHNHILFVEDFIGPTAVYEDQAFLAQLYLHENVFVSSACNNLYRQRQASQVSNVHRDGRYHRVRQYYLEWFGRYLKDHSIHNNQVDALLQKALLPYHHPLRFRVFHDIPLRMIRKVKQIVRKLVNRMAA
jgi:glycosyltransferase involved in cell wall biosynthesis